MRTVIDKLGKVAVTVEKDYWSNKKVYDKLTIVEKSGVFGTYISRKAVPAGTPLSNREYWIPFSSLKENLITDYNAFIDRFNGLINSHDTALNDIQRIINEIFSHLPNGITVECDTEYIRYNTTKRVKITATSVNESAGDWEFLLNGEPIRLTDFNGNTIALERYIANSFEGYIQNCEPNSVIEVNFTDRTLSSGNYTYKGFWNISASYPSYLGFSRQTYSSSILSLPVINTESSDITGRYVRTPNANGYLVLGVPSHTIVEQIRINGFDVQYSKLEDITLNDITYSVYKSTSLYLADVTYPIMINAYAEERGDLIVDILNSLSNLPSPDEEDITYDASTNRYKFANKSYNEGNYTGLGRKYLRRNGSYGYYPFDGFVEGVSVKANTVYFGVPSGVYFDRARKSFVGKVTPGSLQSDTPTDMFMPEISIQHIETYYLHWTRGTNIYFPINPINIFKLRNSEELYRWNGETLARYYGPVEATTNVLIQSMINDANTVYIIQYDYDLLGQAITIPEGCVLKFAGGSFRNGTVIGTNTTVEGTPIFNNINIEGSWSNRVYAPNRPANPYIGQTMLFDIGNKRINETRYIPVWWTGTAWIDANGNEV